MQPNGIRFTTATCPFFGGFPVVNNNILIRNYLILLNYICYLTYVNLKAESAAALVGPMFRVVREGGCWVCWAWRCSGVLAGLFSLGLYLEQFFLRRCRRLLLGLPMMQ